MAYWKNSAKNSRTLDNFGLATSNTGEAAGLREFYELELGVVLDIVMDENHPVYKSGATTHRLIDADRWPRDCKNRPPLDGDLDLTWIGRALVRPLISEELTDKDQLLWAFPMEGNFSEFPLINELVVLARFGDQLYYTKKINWRNWTNNGLDFGKNADTSGKDNTELYLTSPYSGNTKSNTGWKETKSVTGYAGKYYYANNKIRTLKRFEGDMLVESRHGNCILLKAFDKNRGNDAGDPKLPDYKDSGNPMLIIRNRQRKLLDVGETLSLNNSPNLATIEGTIQEKNVGGYIEENINHDGSSIYITSGLTVSEWVTTCYKKMFGMGEEVQDFNGTTTFIYPELSGDQIIIQSDRLILSSRYEEMFQFSKKRHSIVTDSEFTVDAHDQIVLTTHVKTVINSPAIYLGEYDQTMEPALLGQTTVNWLYELCNWLLDHTHWHRHIHLIKEELENQQYNSEMPDPLETQIPVQINELKLLRDNLQVIMSRRVFVTGGGFAPGQDGANI